MRTSKSDPGLNKTTPSSITSSSTHRSVTSRVQSSIANESQKGVFFLISRKVTLAYGPYAVQGVMDYRTERLEGLIRALRKAGGEVILKPSYHVNEVRVWHLEQMIFSCKITDLQHGGDGDLDRKCVEAGYALESSSRKAHYNIKHRYRVIGNFEPRCPCHPRITSKTEVHHRPLRRTGKNIRFSTTTHSTSTSNASATEVSKRGSVYHNGTSSRSSDKDRRSSRAPSRREFSNRRSVSLPSSRRASRAASAEGFNRRNNSLDRGSLMAHQQHQAQDKRRSTSEQNRKQSANSEAAQLRKSSALNKNVA